MDDRLIVLWLFFAQGLMGAFDTLYYHEWKARLPGLGPQGYPELRLHGVRSIVYSLLFAYLPWLRPEGTFALVVMALIFLEIAITLADFVVEDAVRSSIGGVAAGERVSHGVMAIIYGAVLAHLLPVLWMDAQQNTALRWQPVEAPQWLSFVFILMALGVCFSGIRDLLATTGNQLAQWPWASGGASHSSPSQVDSQRDNNQPMGE